MSTIKKSSIDALKEKVDGRIVTPRDSDYDSIREIWNGMIDRKPSLIVQVASARDVQHSVNFARENRLELSARGGGHHIAGNCLTDGGITIDFSNMRNVRVNPRDNRAIAEPGATLAEFDKETLRYGLATPVGINSTTGIAGLTLGGGFGWLTRQHGMTIDNLLSAEVVTADGKKITVSENKHPDLFWAIRGGGGNFGVVTRFEFRLHEQSPEIYAGLLAFPFQQTGEIMRQYREFVRTAPEELNVWLVLRKAPPLPFLPEDVHGKMILVMPVFYNGPIKKGDNLMKFLRGFGDPVGEHAGRQSYVQWQQTFDPLLTPGFRNYWKSHNFTEISDGLIDTMIQYAGTLPSPHTEIFLGMISGVANEVAPDATAYVARDAKFVVNVHGRWEKPKDDQKCIEWARKFYRASLPFASGGAYVNFMTEEEQDRVASAYGSNYKRLVELKQKYDPENLFHMNQNIKPKPLARN